MYKSLKHLVCGRKQKKVTLYELSGKESLILFLKGSLILFLFAYFFYHSYLAILPLSPVFILYIKKERKQLLQKKKEQLKEQFKEAIETMAAGLKAGYSLENAVRKSELDMKGLYGSNSLIIHILCYLRNGMENRIPVEKLLLECGRQSELLEIKQFAQVCEIAKLTGGNMSVIIEQTVQIIQMKIGTDREIDVMLSAKKMEQKIMNIVPFGIILYISTTSKGFFDALYGNITGILIMTMCLLLYLFAYILSLRFTDIKV